MSDRIDQRDAITAALADFATRPLDEAADALFGALGYRSDRRLPIATPAQFCAQLDPLDTLTARERESLDYLTALHLLFQITDTELTLQRQRDCVKPETGKRMSATRRIECRHMCR